MVVVVAGVVLDEEGVEVEEELGAGASKEPCESRQRGVDEEAGPVDLYAAVVVVVEDQKVPFDLVLVRYLVHPPPRRVVSAHLDEVEKCFVSYFALES